MNEFLERALSTVGNGKVSTLEFVNQVINKMREAGLQFDEDEERPRIVDELWELHKKGIIKFSDDLLQFEKASKETSGKG